MQPTTRQLHLGHLWSILSYETAPRNHGLPEALGYYNDLPSGYLT